MSDGPKLYVNKPKKSQLKKSHPSSPSASMASSAQSSSVGATPPPPLHTPQPPKESFARRYRFVWPLLLAVNFTVGAYLFMRTKKKDNKEEATSATGIVSTPVSSTVTTATVPSQTSTTTPSPPPPITEPPKARELIPEKEQRELFKWILEEKRKLKPKDSEEKRRIDEEKAILKQAIRGKQLPSL